MKTVNMHQAKTHLSRLVEEAAKGEPFVIARAGKPLVKVVPLEAGPSTVAAQGEAAPVVKSPRLGFMKGMGKVPDDFDTMFQDEIERMFYGDD